MFQICFYQVYHVVDMYTPKVGILFLIPDLKVMMLKVNVFGRLRREVNELPIRSPPPPLEFHIGKCKEEGEYVKWNRYSKEINHLF